MKKRFLRRSDALSVLVFCVAGAIALAFACGRWRTRDNRAGADRGGSGGADGFDDGTREARPPQSSALMLRYGDGYVPLACFSPQSPTIHGYPSCHESVETLRVVQYPGGESVALKPAELFLEASQEVVVGFVRRERDSASRLSLDEFRGIGLTGNVSFVPTGVWRSVLSGTTDPGEADTRLLDDALQSRLREKVATRLAQEGVKVGTTAVRQVLPRDARTAEKLYVVASEIPADAGQRAEELELPSELHFLFSVAAEGISPVVVNRRGYDFKLGEGGPVLGTLDLDGDGVDELLALWRYSGGRMFELLRRMGRDEYEQVAVFGEGT